MPAGSLPEESALVPAAREAALLLRIYRRLLAPFGAAPLLPLVEARHDTLLRVAELAGGGIAARVPASATAQQLRNATGAAAPHTTTRYPGPESHARDGQGRGQGRG